MSTKWRKAAVKFAKKREAQSARERKIEQDKANEKRKKFREDVAKLRNFLNGPDGKAAKALMTSSATANLIIRDLASKPIMSFGYSGGLTSLSGDGKFLSHLDVRGAVSYYKNTTGLEVKHLIEVLTQQLDALAESAPK